MLYHCLVSEKIFIAVTAPIKRRMKYPVDYPLQLQYCNGLIQRPGSKSQLNNYVNWKTVSFKTNFVGDEVVNVDGSEIDPAKPGGECHK